MTEIRQRRVKVGRLTLNVAELGSGPAVLLLHGFPAYWADFREQMVALAGAGFRAIAPDLPGYGASDRLPRSSDYRASSLVDDLAGLIVTLDLARVHVIGHDWGGSLSFILAAQHPKLVERLVVINAPHPEQLRKALRHSEQIRKSWYMLLFQLPVLPEWLVQRQLVMEFCTRGISVKREAFSDADVARYTAAIRLPGAAHAALNYYRAARRAPARQVPPIVQPTLVLWGERDAALSGPLLLDGLSDHVQELTVQRFANAGHWLHHEEPESVSQNVIRFLSARAES